MNILSVDIDFLFTDMTTIQRYMDTELKPYQSWKVIEWKSGIKDFEPCKESYNFLSALLLKVLKKDTIISRIKEHDEIIKVFEENSVKKAKVFNVDYHHDVSYGNSDEELNIENWVLFGRKKGMIDQYNWITQVDAKPCQHSVMKFNSSDWRDLDLDKIPKMDLIVLCTSHHFTPKKYWGLAKKLEENLKKIKLMLNSDIQNFDLVENDSKNDFSYKIKNSFIDINIDKSNSIPYFNFNRVTDEDVIICIGDIVKHFLKTFSYVGATIEKDCTELEKVLEKFEVIKKIEYNNKKEFIVRCKEWE